MVSTGVGERAISSDGSMTAVASLIAGLRRGEAGQATVFSKRRLSHFLKDSFRSAQRGDFVFLCPSSCPYFILLEYPVVVMAVTLEGSRPLPLVLEL